MMARFAKAAAGAVLLSAMLTGCAGQKVTHFDPVGPKPAGIAADSRAPFSSSVLVGDTLYLAGVLDVDPATRKPGTNHRESARLAMEALKRSVEAAGLTMDDLVWVQVYATDLSSFSDFGAVYGEYFSGPLPARTFVGVAGLMGGARFELNGIAVRRPGR
jgi:2-iminobutanoate/2-iminopropanoate deaminase